MQPLSVEEVLRLHREAQQRRPNEQEAALRCASSTIGRLRLHGTAARAWQPLAELEVQGTAWRVAGSQPLRGRKQMAAGAPCTNYVPHPDIYTRNIRISERHAFGSILAHRRIRAEHVKGRGDDAFKLGNFREAWERQVHGQWDGAPPVIALLTLAPLGSLHSSFSMKLPATAHKPLLNSPAAGTLCAAAHLNLQVQRGAGAAARQGRPASAAQQPQRGVLQGGAARRGAGRR